MSLENVFIRLSAAALCISTLCIVQGNAAQITLKPVGDAHWLKLNVTETVLGTLSK